MNEERAREAIVRYGRLVWERRLTSGSSGNISVRLEDGDILITPSGRSLYNLTSGELVRVASDGTARDPLQHPSSEWPLHLAAYRVRADIQCVLHTHPTFSVVYSKRGSLFARDTVGASESLGTCAWTPYRKNGTLELADLCAREFARGMDVVVMERHGLSVVGATLEDAFVQSDLAEEASRIAYFSTTAADEPRDRHLEVQNEGPA